MQLDHIVLWVDDPLRSVEFFDKVLGFAGVRVEEFRAKQTMFPSVRISADTIIDLMPKAVAPKINSVPGAAGTAGHPTNHVCLAMTETEFNDVQRRLEANGTPVTHFMEKQFGARGTAPKAFYFKDPDGNVLEARYYAE